MHGTMGVITQPFEQGHPSSSAQLHVERGILQSCLSGQWAHPGCATCAVQQSVSTTTLAGQRWLQGLGTPDGNPGCTVHLVVSSVVGASLACEQQT